MDNVRVVERHVAHGVMAAVWRRSSLPVIEVVAEVSAAGGNIVSHPVNLATPREAEKLKRCPDPMARGVPVLWYPYEHEERRVCLWPSASDGVVVRILSGEP